MGGWVGGWRGSWVVDELRARNLGGSFGFLRAPWFLVSCKVPEKRAQVNQTKNQTVTWRVLGIR